MLNAPHRTAAKELLQAHRDSIGDPDYDLTQEELSAYLSKLPKDWVDSVEAKGRGRMLQAK